MNYFNLKRKGKSRLIKIIAVGNKCLMTGTRTLDNKTAKVRESFLAADIDVDVDVVFLSTQVSDFHS